MKSLLFAATCALLLIISTATTAHATCPGHPAGSTATYQGGFTIELTLSAACSVRCDVCTWLTTGGNTDFTLDASSIRFSNSTDGIDSATPVLFELLAQTAIAQGEALGYIKGSNDCAAPTTIRVYQAACVQRTGAGADTRFLPCDASAFSARIFKLCAPAGQGEVNISLSGIEGSVCGGTGDGGCEPTCR